MAAIGHCCADRCRKSSTARRTEFPLLHAADAHRLSEQGRKRGKIVLRTEVI
ncbi:zinc-binding dehydrogenase [Rhodomicrobium sp.]|uniref:zinc-binding dehydrogenase n=1 Tax=Rhodomicrobium sp. TaxID=2720632 RepID=UPI0039E28486